MKIMYLTSNLAIGGTELLTLDYAKAMKINGHSVYWVSRSDGAIKDTIISEGIDILSCPLQRRLPLEAIISVIKMRRYIKRFKIDVVHAVDAYTALIMMLAVRGLKYKPKTIWSSVGIGTSSYSLMRKICDSHLNCIITPSHFIRNRMIEERFHPEKIIVYAQSRYMVDSRKDRNELRHSLGIDETDVVVGSIGRVVYMKGNRTLLEALPEMLSVKKNIKLMIVGDGQERSELENLSRELNVSDHVIFTGFRLDIENMYNAFDIVAFPTYYEALGYIPFEAMYYERPLVASLTGGIPEVVKDGYNGLLVPPADRKRWAKAILSITEDVSLAQKLKNNGKDYYNRYFAYDEKHIALEKIYESVLNGQIGMNEYGY